RYPVAMSKHHARCELPAMLKRDVAWDVALVAALLVVNPYARQVELAVEQGDRATSRVCEELAHLALLFLPQPTAPLALSTDRLRTGLLEPAAVENQDAIRSAHALADLAHHQFAEPCVLPLPCADEMLQRARLQIAVDGDRLDRPAAKSPCAS